MAARKRRLELSESWKDNIRVGVIASRLYAHVNGENDLSATQINAAKILLAKLVPDLNRAEVTSEGGGPLQVIIQRFGETK